MFFKSRVTNDEKKPLSCSLPNTNIQLFTLTSAVLMLGQNCQEHPRMIYQIHD